MTLPKFTYHPDPVATGSVEPSPATCLCCGKARGHVYRGPVFAIDELEDCICPWCIADGSAHIKFDGEFTDFDGIGDYGSWEDVPDSVKEEIAFRTPGFSGWQQERWWTHCGDAAEFIGLAGKAEVRTHGDSLVAYLKSECEIDDEAWSYYSSTLSVDGSPTAYLFRCRHCGTVGGYTDCY